MERSEKKVLQKAVAIISNLCFKKREHMKQIEHLNVCAVLTSNRITELDPSSLDPPSLFEQLECLEIRCRSARCYPYLHIFTR